MRRWLFLFSVLFVIFLMGACGAKEPQVKYVFYFIGDGMGVNQVNGAEMYLAELDRVVGAKPFNFSSFPVRNYITTYSSFNGVTCSAAAGTALSTGEKTKNGTIGMDKMHQDSLCSIAVKAKRIGRKVGIVTNVGVNHATPASFYGHQPKRDMYFELGKDAIIAGFDLYGGGGVIQSVSPKDSFNLFRLFEDAGYSIARGYDTFREKIVGASKLVVIQGGSKTILPYAIDRDEEDLTLSQMTEGAIDFLKRDDRGFFLMVEGGLIDYACHANDGATVFGEIVDFSEAVQKAYDFYLKHPEETLIVITADHETGGIALGTGSYQLDLKVLKNQKMSMSKLSQAIGCLRDSKKNGVEWHDIKMLLGENLGFWREVVLSEKDEKLLKDCYLKTFQRGEIEMAKNLYSEDEPIAKLAVSILNQMAKISWAHSGHTAGVVPVYAVGVGADQLNGRLDNTDIPKIVERIAGY